MTATITVNGANATIAFSYTATVAVVTATAGAAAEELYNRGLGNHGTEESPKLFSTCTNQDKANILDGYIRDIINDLAKMFKLNQAAEIARVSSLTDSSTNLHI